MAGDSPLGPPRSRIVRGEMAMLLNYRVEQLEKAVEGQSDVIEAGLREIREVLNETPDQHKALRSAIMQEVADHYVSKVEGEELRSIAKMNRHTIYIAASLTSVFLSLLIVILQWKF